MTQHLGPKQSPEERELERQKATLTTLEDDLAQRELEFATFQNELRAFEARYVHAVGAFYAELDELEAQIAEAHARSRPDDQDFGNQASEARAKAIDSAHAAGVAAGIEPPADFKPTEDLKKLYREVAKQVHPDLATNESNRARRTRLMAEANEAYAEGNAAKLRAILDEWENSPEMVEGEGIAAELVRTIRKIHQVEQRLAAIEAQLSDLTTSELNRLMEKVAAAKARGRDLLAEMADQLRTQVDAARHRLDRLSSREAKT